MLVYKHIGVAYTTFAAGLASTFPAMYGIIITCLLIASAAVKGTHALMYAGCFRLEPTAATPKDVVSIGWTDQIGVNVDEQTIPTCIDHCKRQGQKYAAIQTISKTVSCLCGGENAYVSLGSLYHSNIQGLCYHKIWSFSTFVAVDDLSERYVGCFKEDAVNEASSANRWIDSWRMSPRECIRYCENNRADYANIKVGDTCTCSSSFAMYGRVDDTECNSACSGNAGERCGGALANSVYFTMNLKEALSVQSLVIFDHAQGRSYYPVKIPNTQLLLGSLINLTESGQLVEGNQEALALRNHLTTVNKFAQYLLEMKQPLEDLVNSEGFIWSLSPRLSIWLSRQFPPDLQMFVDVVKYSKTFINQDVKSLLDYVNSFITTAVQLKNAIDFSIFALQNYVDNDVTDLGIGKTLELAKLMATTSRTCILKLKTTKDVMVNNVEGLSDVLFNGPHGIRNYSEYLKHPFTSSSAASAVAPTVDVTAWKDELKEIATTWSLFTNVGVKPLGSLISDTYHELCTAGYIGKRETCEDIGHRKLLALLKASDGNKIQQKVQSFMEQHREAFNAFDWSNYVKKLKAMLAGFQSISQYLRKAGAATADDVLRLEQAATSYQYYPVCADAMTNMIHDVCHSSLSAPLDSKVQPITC